MTTKIFKLFALTVLFVVSTSLFTACEENDVQTSKTQSSIQEKDDDGDTPGGSITIGMRLHRGEAWSKKNGVKPCTEGFGVCRVRVEAISGEYKQVKVIVKFTPTSTSRTSGESNATARIVFLEDVNATEGQIFISSDDDDFIFPSDINQLLKLSELTILADDYETHIDSEYPYGYVDVNCIAK